MKQLSLIRHAKSSPRSEGLRDFERPLNARGREDAPEMARRLAEAGLAPELLISSPAERARQTTAVLVDALGLPPERVRFERAIYEAGRSELVTIARELPDALERVAVVGHNPTLTDTVNWLCGAAIDNVPTMGVVQMQLDIAGWVEIRQGSGTLRSFDYPKNPSP